MVVVGFKLQRRRRGGGLTLVIEQHAQTQQLNKRQELFFLEQRKARQVVELDGLAVITHQGRHHGLLLLVEARQIAVLQNVGRMAVHPAVVDVQPHLVQHRGPFQQRGKLRVRELRILLLPLFVHLHRGVQHALRLFTVDVVLIGETLRGAAANILMAEAAFHLIQHAFTQRAVRQTQLFYGEGIKHAAENSQPRHEYRFTLVGKTRQA